MLLGGHFNPAKVARHIAQLPLGLYRAERTLATGFERFHSAKIVGTGQVDAEKRHYRVDMLEKTAERKYNPKRCVQIRRRKCERFQDGIDHLMRFHRVMIDNCVDLSSLSVISLENGSLR